MVSSSSNSSPFFQPEGAWVGDVIPFEHDGEFLLFYLREDRDDPESGTPWGLVSTRDFLSYADRGVVLPAGDRDAPDFNAYTGSVVEDGGELHLFYTGHNPRHFGPDGVTPVQLVMHATSEGDVTAWRKHPEWSFGAPNGYEAGDWRDPFVFRAAPDEPWRMLLAARHDTGPRRRRGVIAQLRSDDLVSWSIDQPFWDPRRYITHECPDVFQWGEWWYLVYSEFSESFTTRYRIARTPDGPWHVPTHDSIDGRAFYAAKSVSRDGRRFFIGWIASKAGDCDDGPWQWAGTMSVLEATQNPDGTLGFGIPAEVRHSFTTRMPEAEVAAAQLAVPDGYEAAVSAVPAPRRFLLQAEFEVEETTTEFGILLRASPDGDSSYVIRIEPKQSRMVFDRWPRRTTGAMQWQISGDQPHQVELERPCDLAPGTHRLEILVDDSLCIAVLDEQTVLSTRIYDHADGHVGYFVGEGSVTVSDFRLSTR